MTAGKGRRVGVVSLPIMMGERSIGNWSSMLVGITGGALTGLLLNLLAIRALLKAWGRPSPVGRREVAERGTTL